MAPSPKGTLLLKRVSLCFSLYCFILLGRLQNPTCYVYINNSLPLARKYVLGYLSADIICSETRTVLRECSSRNTVSFKEQIMYKDKKPEHIFKFKWKLLCLLPFKYFSQQEQIWKLALSGYGSNCFSITQLVGQKRQ